MKLYCYKGDVKKLIPAGWKFQKLYARDYKTYFKNDIFMFVVTKMCLEISNVKSKHQPLVIKFILDNIDKPSAFWETYSSPFFKDTLFAEWALQDGKIVTQKQASTNKVEWMLSKEKDKEYLEDGFHIEYELVETIKNLTELGDVVLLDIK